MKAECDFVLFCFLKCTSPSFFLLSRTSEDAAAAPMAAAAKMAKAENFMMEVWEEGGWREGRRLRVWGRRERV